jgi:hypothetical protein
MPIVPAFCDTCGTVFNSGIFIESSTDIVLSGNRSGPCPQCGEMGHIPDGVFNFIDNTIEILSAPARTIQELTKLAEILHDAKTKAQSKEEVTDRINKEIPTLSLLGKLLPDNRSDLYGFLSLIMTVVPLLMEPSKPSINSFPINVNQIIEINVNQSIERAVVQPHRSSKTFSTKPIKKVGRNESCPCQSGKKFKKCCGAIQ